MKDYPIPASIMYKALRLSPSSVIIADPQISGTPFIFVNQSFEKLTGYSKEEIIGKNGAYLQGADTNPEALNRISEAIKNKVSVTEIVKNYKKNGEPFYNELTIQPIWDENEHLYYFGTQKDVTDIVRLREEVQRHEEIIELLKPPTILLSKQIAILPVSGYVREESFDLLCEKSSQWLYDKEVETLLFDFTGTQKGYDGFIQAIHAFCKQLQLLGIQVIVTGLNSELVQEWSSNQAWRKEVKFYATVYQALRELQFEMK
ncbi:MULTISPECIES: PAS domain-containing protein [Listeria]|uniref:PAS domain-containing protein n=1 Tax=Listeria TaxID=1637 RepID=UPI000B5918DF|nr:MULTISPECIES: PAS domain-containing protein [Listeria]